MRGRPPRAGVGWAAARRQAGDFSPSHCRRKPYLRRRHVARFSARTAWAVNFLFPSRIARASYWVRSVLVGVLLIPISNGLETDLAGKEFHPASLKWIAAFLVLAAYSIIFVVLPRSRDLNMSRWEKVLVFIPPLGLPFWARLAWSRSRPFLDSPHAASAPLPLETPPPSPTPTARTATSANPGSLARLKKLRDDETLTEAEFQRMKFQPGL